MKIGIFAVFPRQIKQAQPDIIMINLIVILAAAAVIILLLVWFKFLRKIV
jgi:hypothetical protein